MRCQVGEVAQTLNAISGFHFQAGSGRLDDCRPLRSARASRSDAPAWGLPECVNASAIFKGEMDIQSKGNGSTIAVTFPLVTTAVSEAGAILQPSEAVQEAAG